MVGIDLDGSGAEGELTIQADVADETLRLVAVGQVAGGMRVGGNRFERVRPLPFRVV